MNKKQRRQQGFTLIEIIAVIILLGVLAATVIPKFSDLTDEAKESAAQQAVAEGIARVNSSAAKYILATGTAPTTLANLTAHGLTATEDVGDYTITYTQEEAGDDITITVDGKENTPSSGVEDVVGTAPLPVAD